MAIGVFTVKATIAPDREKAFNEWYNNEHVPDVLRYKGVVSARRYKATVPEDRFQYIAVYEFASEEILSEFLKSDFLKALKKEYDAHFGDVSERQWAGYTQVWP